MANETYNYSYEMVPQTRTIARLDERRVREASLSELLDVARAQMKDTLSSQWYIGNDGWEKQQNIYNATANQQEYLDALRAAMGRESFVNESLNLAYSPEQPPQGPSDEYKAKLKAIGATALLQKVDADADIARFIDEVKMRGLRFYSKPNVEAYLLTEARKANIPGPRVVWTPVAQYTQAIPSPVIDTMVWIKGEFPSAEFRISEIKSFPDPFLMVVLHGREMLIEKWDEAAYREE